MAHEGLLERARFFNSNFSTPALGWLLAVYFPPLMSGRRAISALMRSAIKSLDSQVRHSFDYGSGRITDSNYPTDEVDDVAGLFMFA